MSFSIPQSFVDQFSANVLLLSEQRMSRLMPTVQQEDVTGESFARERIGMTKDVASVTTDRHGDTPLDNTPHTRRWGFIQDYDVADLIDRQDRIRLLIDPQSSYTIKHAGTMGRTMDDEIIRAMRGSAATGRDGAGSQALPAGQKIPHGGTGMTLAKLIQAKEILDANEVDPMIPRYMALNARGISQLLEDEKLTSADYNTVRALQRGTLDEFMSFTFIRLERLPNDGSGNTFALAYTSLATVMGIAARPSTIVAPRPDKRMAQQLYTWGTWGAVRVEDEMVVEVAYDDPSTGS
ncbi:MAG: hypothetical protein GVY32_04155 [Gammaproteobacteria bacterium]|nr:hypothetical protein [Gammaproteobacteria bacterium]